MRSKQSKPESSALARALRLLARREHSRHELQQKLRLRGLNTSAIDAALDELERRGWLSEERFCEAYVNSRRARGVGPVRIIAELRTRGITGDLALRQVDPYGAHWREQAALEYRKRYGSTAPQDRLEYARRARYLAGKGFPAELIREVCKNLSKSSTYVD